MTLYLTPGASQAGHHINFYYQKRIQDVGMHIQMQLMCLIDLYLV